MAALESLTLVAYASSRVSFPAFAITRLLPMATHVNFLASDRAVVTPALSLAVFQYPSLCPGGYGCCAEGEGFEPPNRLDDCRVSSAVL